jgi:hypothetical protein
LALTVRGLLSLPRLGLTVHAGAAGLDREIRWAHAIELDDPTPLLTGGERWESAASSLGIHRHSLRYRIRKVEQLTGRSMESSAARSEFLIAITARDFVHNMATVEAPPP